MTRRMARTASRAALALISLVAPIGCFMQLAGCLGEGGEYNFPKLAASDGGDAGDSRPADGMASDVGMDVEGSVHDAGGGDGDATLQDAHPQVTGALAQFDQSPIDLGMVACGSATVHTFHVTNGGTSKLGVTAMTTGSAFQVSPTSLLLNSGEEGVLSITASIGSMATAGSMAVGSLNLFTTDPMNANMAIHLSATATGATLASSRPSVDLGAWPVGTPAQPQMFTIQNTGNAPVTVNVGSPSDPEFALSNVPDGGMSFMLAGQQILTTTVAFTPASSGDKTASVAVGAGSTGSGTAGAAMCGTSIAGISLTGSGTVGKIGGYPPSLAFDANCSGQPPQPQTFTLINTGGSNVSVTAAQFDNAGAGFTVSPGAGTIPPDGGLPFTVSAPAFPPPSASTQPGNVPAAVSATLNITTAGDPSVTAPISIPVKATPVGASLTFDVSSLQFNSVSVQGSVASPFNVVNSGSNGSGSAGGNANVTLTIVATGAPDGGADAQAAAGGPSPFSFGMSGMTAMATTQFMQSAMSQPQSESVTFTPVALGPSYAEIVMTVDPSTVLCAPLPQPLLVSGIGSGLSFDSPAVTFYAPCDGKTNPSAPALNLTNTTDASVLWAIGGNDITGPGKSLYYVASVTSPDGGVDDASAGLLRTLGPMETAMLDIVSTLSLPSALMADGGVTLNDAGMPWSAPNPANLAAQLSISAQFLPGGANAGPAVIPIDEVPVGDQLSVAIGGVAITNLPPFGPVSIGDASAPQTFFVTNNANPAPGATPPYAGASVVVTSTNPAFIASTPPLVGADASAPVTVTYAPTSVEAGTAMLQVTQQAAAPLCAPLPPPISVSGGGGTEGIASITSTDFATGSGDGGTGGTFDFGLVDCGSAGTQKTFVITNGGNQPFNITGATFGSATSQYAVTVTDPAGALLPAPPTSTTPLALSPTQKATFAVSPTIPAQVPDPTNTTYQDTLTVTTDAFGSPPPSYAIALTTRPQGAVIVDTMPPLLTTWAFGTVANGSTGTITNEIRNTGNAPVTVSLSAGPTQLLPGVFGLAPNPTSAQPQATTPIVGQFKPNVANGSWTGEGTLTVSGALCEPLPAQWGSPSVNDAGQGADGGVAGVLITISGNSN